MPSQTSQWLPQVSLLPWLGCLACRAHGSAVEGSSLFLSPAPFRRQSRVCRKRPEPAQVRPLPEAVPSGPAP